MTKVSKKVSYVASEAWPRLARDIEIVARVPTQRRTKDKKIPKKKKKSD
jgi:hypothetical protein